MEREWSVGLESSGSITDQGTMWRSTSAGWDSAHIAHLLVAYSAQLRFWTLLFSRSCLLYMRSYCRDYLARKRASHPRIKHTL